MELVKHESFASYYKWSMEFGKTRFVQICAGMGFQLLHTSPILKLLQIIKKEYLQYESYGSQNISIFASKESLARNTLPRTRTTSQNHLPQLFVKWPMPIEGETPFSYNSSNLG